MLPHAKPVSYSLFLLLWDVSVPDMSAKSSCVKRDLESPIIPAPTPADTALDSHVIGRHCCVDHTHNVKHISNQTSKKCKRWNESES